MVVAVAASVLREVEREVGETQVLVFCGGQARRMGKIDRPKPLLEVCGKPLIDRCMEYFMGCGFRTFVLLLARPGTPVAEAVYRHVTSREHGGAVVKLVWDPPVWPVGKGKALKYAVESGAVDRRRRALIAFPDDIFLDRSLPLRFLLHHVEMRRRRDVWASVCLVHGAPYPYGVAQVGSDGLVRSFTEKPVVEYYTSTGMYILEPEALQLAVEMVDMDDPEPVEFEDTLIPSLAYQGKLAAFVIPRGTWIPVNTLKDLDRANLILCKERGKKPFLF